MNYCPSLFLQDICYPAEYWTFIWSAAQVILVGITALIGIPKIYLEVKSIKEAREAENEQKRTDFFLSQHRRLFDDEVLYAILKKLDGDEISLAETIVWDDKRKFLTFIEEIELLTRAKKINPNVAYYMFGYYATQARDGENFCVGIDLCEEYWGIFFSFCRKAEIFLNHLKSHPNEINNLKI